MIDIQLIRDNPELVKQKAAQKKSVVDIDMLLELDANRLQLLQEVEDIRRRRNENAEAIKQAGTPDQVLIDKGKQIKIELAEREGYLVSTEKQWLDILKQVPNMPLDNVPVGATENENVVVKEWGAKPVFDFQPKNHWELGYAKGWIDKERAAKVSGSRFAYLKGGLVELQFALIQFAFQTLANEETLKSIIIDNNLTISSKPFIPVLPPALVRTDAYEPTGRLNAEETTYKLSDDDLWLNASAEHSLCNMYMNEILNENDLPIRYVGYSTSFRREAGTYGKDMEGIIRMHQFNKVEMEVFSTPETGAEEHRFMVAIQEYLMQRLNLPYRVINKCTADIGGPNASGVDIDAWLAGENRYLETHTADYMTDYQARRLKTKLRRSDGELSLVHTNDATAFSQRPLVAIIENYQTADGQVRIPDVLKPYMGNKETI